MRDDVHTGGEQNSEARDEFEEAEPAIIIDEGVAIEVLFGWQNDVTVCLRLERDAHAVTKRKLVQEEAAHAETKERLQAETRRADNAEAIAEVESRKAVVFKVDRDNFRELYEALQEMQREAE